MFAHFVDVSALSICIVLRAFVVISMCLWFEISRLMFMFMGSVANIYHMHRESNILEVEENA